jgi:cobalamin-dependent methionine synthase I
MLINKRGAFFMGESQDRICIYDPLAEFMAHYADAKSSASSVSSYEGLAVEDRLKKRIIDGDRIGLDTDLADALKSYSALAIINDILLEGMKVVGDLFGSGQMQLPFVLQSAETMKAAVKYLEPFMDKLEGDTSKGKMVIATVKGDVHDIGKNLVDIILTNNGYTVYNLGIKVGLEQMLEEVERRNADALGMSGLLVKSTAIMKENLEVMQSRDIHIPVILGGAALTRKFVEQDLRSLYGGTLGYAQDAFDGLRFMEQLKNPPAKVQAKDVTLAEMISELDRIRTELFKVIEPIDDVLLDVPNTFNKWSLRDVLIHLGGWERIAVERIKVLKHGGIPEPIQFENASAINQQYIDASPLHSKDEIIAELTSIRNELLTALNEITAEQFERSGDTPAMKKWLPQFTYAHEAEHLQRIRDWLGSREDELDTATGLDSKIALASQLPWMTKQSVVSSPVKPVVQGITRSLNVPTPPFWGVELRELWILDKIWEYLNDVALFRGQWQFKKGKLTTEAHRKIIDETARPKLDELKLLCKREKILQPKAVYGYFPCWSEGDSVVIAKPKNADDLVTKWNDVSLDSLVEYERFTFPRQTSERKLCIADFFLSYDEVHQAGRPDVIALSAVTVGRRASEYTSELFAKNLYADYLYLHGLSVETAEALAEYLHKIIRTELGIHISDADDVRRLFSQGYQGSRYSFGYPACPNLEDQTKLFRLLAPERIGITLTEEYHLEPEQSTTAIIAHHPAARYFGIK